MPRLTEGQTYLKVLSRIRDSSPFAWHQQYRYRLVCQEETHKAYQARFRQRLRRDIPEDVMDIITDPECWGIWYSHLDRDWFLASEETNVRGAKGRPKIQVGVRGGAYQLLITYPAQPMARTANGSNLIAVNAAGMATVDMWLAVRDWGEGSLQYNDSEMIVIGEHAA